MKSSELKLLLSEFITNQIHMEKASSNTVSKGTNIIANTRSACDYRKYDVIGSTPPWLKEFHCCRFTIIKIYLPLIPQQKKKKHLHFFHLTSEGQSFLCKWFSNWRESVKRAQGISSTVASPLPLFRKCQPVLFSVSGNFKVPHIQRKHLVCTNIPVFPFFPPSQLLKGEVFTIW